MDGAVETLGKVKRKAVLTYARERYGVMPDAPWLDDPESLVLRHGDNKKWFGLLMSIPGKRLGLKNSGIVQVLNVKADPNLISAFIDGESFFPAYHMNREHWLSILLDGISAALMDMSLSDCMVRLPLAVTEAPISRAALSWR